MTLADLVTVLLVTSPTASDPSLDTIHATLRSVRYFPELAGCRILIGCDGVRPEQRAELADRYREKLTALTVYAAPDARLEVRRLERWGHQANVLRRLLSMVTTPLVLFVEHDTPLLPQPIDWAGCTHELEPAGDDPAPLDLLRFHHESQVLPVHAHLMLDTVPDPTRPVRYLRTAQWSQRPHLARTDWYRDVLAEYFATSSRTMVEDVMHGVCDYYWRLWRKEGWRRFRLAIYAPKDPTMQRSDHLDGRAGDRKYECCFAYPAETPIGAPAPTRLRYD